MLKLGCTNGGDAYYLSKTEKMKPDRSKNKCKLSCTWSYVACCKEKLNHKHSRNKKLIGKLKHVGYFASILFLLLSGLILSDFDKQYASPPYIRTYTKQ